VRVRLETGRRNQIRVHFAEMGHPVLGDVRYRPDQARHPRWKVRRLALHAGVLGFVHPQTEQPLRFESPMPAEFRAFLGEGTAAQIEPEAGPVRGAPPRVKAQLRAAHAGRHGRRPQRKR
jgi:hypothetical protein